MKSKQGQCGGQAIGWMLLTSSGLLWAAMFAIPFLKTSVAARAAMTGGAFVAAEILFWLGLVMLGSSVATHLRWFSAPFAGHKAAERARLMGREGLRGKIFAVIGASGGLGAAIAANLLRQGAHVIPVVRNAANVPANGDTIDAIQVDLERSNSIEAGLSALPMLDGAIFATGMDVRAPLSAHANADISRQILINLEGPILATRLLLQRMKDGGVIAHVGGFADGRLALPYYSADVASRAGLAAFCEAVTREMKLEGRDIVVSYLCPEPADTEAERPFLTLWRRMGTRIASPDAVAAFVVNAMKRRAKSEVMGQSTWLLAKINALSPDAADAIALNGIGRHLRDAFGRPQRP